MTMGRFIGYPEVYPWDTIKVISLATDTTDPPLTYDMNDEIGGAPRGFIITSGLVLECVPWGHTDDTFINVGFTAGVHFGCIRKFKSKGVGSNTSGTATTIAFFK